MARECGRVFGRCTSGQQSLSVTRVLTKKILTSCAQFHRVGGVGNASVRESTLVGTMISHPRKFVQRALCERISMGQICFPGLPESWAVSVRWNGNTTRTVARSYIFFINSDDGKDCLSVMSWLLAMEVGMV